MRTIDYILTGFFSVYDPLNLKVYPRRYNKYLTTLVFSGLTVSYGPLSLLLRLGHKSTGKNYSSLYRPRTRSVTPSNIITCN